jgi:hypothetical protein
MKYILLILLFFSCQKSSELQEPERTVEPRVDSVTIVREVNTWYVVIQARVPTEHHRAIHMKIVFNKEKIFTVLKLPAGETEAKYKLNPVYGEPLSWKAIHWGEWQH